MTPSSSLNAFQREFLQDVALRLSTGTWCGRRCARRVARARALARFEIQPSDFNMRLDNILRSSTTQLSELAHSVQMIQELWSEIVTLTHGSYAPETFL